LLQARLNGERQQMARIADGLAQRAFAVPWMAQAPVGLNALSKLLAS
jgi:arsenite-transporting ATPase